MDRFPNVELLAPSRHSPDATPPGRATLLRAVMIVGAVAVIAVAWNVTSGAPESADRELVRLLRGMAAIKGLLAIGAAVVVGWRLARPIGTTVAGFYLVGVWMLFAAACLIWHVALIPLAALLFHAAAAGLLAVSFREGWGPSLRSPRRGGTS